MSVPPLPLHKNCLLVRVRHIMLVSFSECPFSLFSGYEEKEVRFIARARKGKKANWQMGIKHRKPKASAKQVLCKAGLLTVYQLKCDVTP